jgi:hypothetical protein
MGGISASLCGGRTSSALTNGQMRARKQLLQLVVRFDGSGRWGRTIRIRRD